MANTTSVFGGKLELGPMNLYINAFLPSGFTLEPTGDELFLRGNGSVDIFMEIEKAELHTAQGGTKALDRVITGVEARVETTCRETNLELLGEIMQGFNLSPISGTPAGFVFVKNIGEQDSDIATTMRGTIIEAGVESTDALDSVYLLAVAPQGSVQYTYNSSDQREAKFVFNAYPSDDVLYQSKPVILFGGDILSAGLVTQ